MNIATPLHESLYAEMRERIRSGVWPEGSRIPSEQALMAEFGTSRAPIRQALAALRTEGAVIGGRGAPPTVRRPIPSQSYQSFVSFTEWARSLGRVPGQRMVEGARRPASEPIAEALHCAPGDQIVEIVRLRLLDDEPAMLERSAFPLQVGLPLLAADLNVQSIYQTLGTHGLAPVRARHVIDAVAAGPLDAELLTTDAGAPLLRVRRISWNSQGALIETADDRYLPSMATFAIENSVEQRSLLTRESVGD